MTDQNTAPATQSTETESEETPTPEQSWLNKVTTNHPRLAKVAAITGAIGTAGFVGLVVNNISKNSHRVEAAKDHLELAAGEFSEAVSPTSEPTDA